MSASVDSMVEFIKVLGGPGAVAGLGWWLRGKFVGVEKAGEQRMLKHEHQDERRHRQNLVRFAKLNTKLGIPDYQETNGGLE